MKAAKNKGAQTNTKKLTVKKIVIYVLLLLTSPFWLLYLLYFAYAGFSIELFLPQDKMALSYLQERYGQEFKIIRSTGGSSLGGSISYRERAAPISNPSLEFDITKCLARCSNYDHTDFSDNYPNAIYKDELTRYIQKNASTFGLSLKTDNIRVSAGFSDDNFDDTVIFKPGTKHLVPAMELPYRALDRFGLILDITTANKNPSQKDIDRYAATIAKIRDYFALRGISTIFYYTITTEEKAKDSTATYERYYVYKYRTPNGNKTDTNDPTTISKQFLKEKRSRRIMN